MIKNELATVLEALCGGKRVEEGGIRLGSDLCNPIYRHFEKLYLTFEFAPKGFLSIYQNLEALEDNQRTLRVTTEFF